MSHVKETGNDENCNENIQGDRYRPIGKCQINANSGPESDAGSAEHDD